MLLLPIIGLKGQSTNATMTLYKDGFALIKQPAAWRAPTGKSVIKYDRLPKGILADSPFLSLKGATILTQRMNSNLFSGNEFFHNKLGQTVVVRIDGEKTQEGILLEYNSATITLQKKSEVLTIPSSKIDYISFKTVVENPRFKPVLSWKIATNKAKKVKGELVYLSGGFAWNAIYRMVIAEKSGTAELIPEAYITNTSDVDFSKLQLQLVEGNLHRAGYQPVRPRVRSTAARLEAADMAAPPIPTRESLGDYHIYALPDRLEFRGNESITVRLYDSREIAYQKTYLFENSERAQSEEPLQVELKFENVEDNNLNVPLPAGKIALYSTSKKGALEFIGEDRLKQVPKGESAIVIAGRAFDVIGKRKVLNYDRQRKSEEAAIEITVNNTKDEEIQVRLVEHINGDWVIREASHDYIKKDASTIHFPLTIKSNGSEYVTYTYRKEWK